MANSDLENIGTMKDRDGAGGGRPPIARTPSGWGDFIRRHILHTLIFRIFRKFF
jgi:hypothetical protein